MAKGILGDLYFQQFFLVWLKLTLDGPVKGKLMKMEQKLVLKEKEEEFPWDTHWSSVD